MIFLNPAVLIGLLAASIPVLIHLLNLRKLKRIEFSTLTFLKELQKNKIRRIKIKQLLLLALRVMIVLFIVMAFARPTLKSVSIGGASSAAKTTAVFILDNTFSMSVVDNNGSYFNQAKETIKKLLNQLQEGDEAALVLVAKSTKNNLSADNELKTTSNLVEFKKQLDAVDISACSGYLNDALVNAAKILSRSQNFNKEIYLLTDFQKGRIFAQPVSNLGEIFNEKVKLYAFNFSGKDVFNIGIDNLKVNTQIFEENKPVNFSVAVTNYSSKTAENIIVSLFLNNERTAQQSLTLQPDETKNLTMEAAAKKTGFIDAFTELEDDDIKQDNKRYSGFYIPEEIPVAVFAEDLPDAKYINLALSSGNNTSLKVTLKGITQISSFDLNQFGAVILIGLDNLNDFQKIISYVKNGGGLFIIPSSKSDLNSFKKITEFGIPEPGGTAGKVNSTDNAITFENINFNHPIFQNIFSKEKQKIESPEIYYHFKITPGGHGKNIISLIDGSSFLSEYNLGKGKILLLNSTPIVAWGNFPLKSIFVPLINKSVFYLASKEEFEDQYLTGSQVMIDASKQSLPQIKIERPDKSEDFINLKEQNNRRYVTYYNTNAAGNYHVYSGNKMIDDFEINVDPLESVTKYISQNEFKDYLKKINFKGEYISIDKNDDPAKIVLESRFGSELWKYFLFFALILALAEMMIARNQRKEMVNLS